MPFDSLPTENAVVIVLRLAREKIKNRKNWTQFSFARDRRRFPVPYVAPDAVKWCAAGAVCVVCSGDAIRSVSAIYCAPAARRALERALPRNPLEPRDLETWNDVPGRTHAEVLALFDRAIAAAGG